MPGVEAYIRQLDAIYAGVEQRCTALVARYASRGLDTPFWLQRRLSAASQLQQELQQIVQTMAGESEATIRAAVRKAANDGWRAAANDMRSLAGVPLDIRPSVEAIDTLARRAVESVQATHLRIVRESMDAYRGIVTQVAGQAMGGTDTRRTATQTALDRFADQGITGFVDTAGRAWALSSYVEMAVRSTTAQATVEAKMDGYQQRGHDLVVVSDSPEECPLCRPWEGRVLSISGQSHEYKSVEWATNAGLFHPNCTHTLGLYIEGDTRLPKGGTANRLGYEQRQQQRYMERQVRKWKRRESVAMDDATRLRCRAKVKEWQGKLRTFTRQNDRMRLYYREQLRFGKPGGGVPEGTPTPTPTPEAQTVMGAWSDDVAREASERVQIVMDHSVARRVDLPPGRDEGEFRTFQQYYRPKGGDEETIGVLLHVRVNEAEAEHAIPRVVALNADGSQYVVSSGDLRALDWYAAHGRGVFMQNVDFTSRSQLLRDVKDLMPDGVSVSETVNDALAMYLLDPEALARQAPDLFRLIHGFAADAAQKMDSWMLRRPDILARRLAKEIKEAEQAVRDAAEAARLAALAQQGGPGALRRTLDNLPHEKKALVNFARTLAGGGHVAESGMKNLDEPALRDLLEAIAEELDLRKFRLYEIVTARGNAIARGGSGHLSFRWQWFKEHRFRRDLAQRARICPKPLADTLDGVNLRVLDWKQRAADKLALLRGDLDDFAIRVEKWQGRPDLADKLARIRGAGQLSDEDVLALAREVMDDRAFPIDVRHVQAKMRWHVEDHDKSVDTLARWTAKLDDVKKAGDPAPVSFHQTGDAVVDGVAYEMPHNAEAWQQLFTPIPGHEGSDYWGVVTHECGHNRWYELLPPDKRSEYVALHHADKRAGHLISPSTYGITGARGYGKDSDGIEHFAECWQTYRAWKLTGDDRYRQLIPDWAIPFLEMVA